MQPRDNEGGYLRLALACCALVLVLRALWWEFAGPVHGDIAWGLTVADQMAAGRVLYRDILDINPPLAFWLFSIARWLGRAIGVTAEDGHRILTITVCSGSVGATLALTRNWRWAVLLPVALFALIGRDFGQREHLIVALLLPLLVRPTVLPRWADVAVGLAAGLALCLKPYYTPIWLGAIAVRGRPTRADAIVLMTGFAYVGAVALLTPDYFAMVQRYAPAYASFNRHGMLELLLRPQTLLAGAVTVAAFLAGERQLSVAAVGALLAFLAQAKGWTYHSFPLLAFALLAASVGVQPSRRLLPAALALILVGAFLGRRLVAPDERVADYEWSARQGLASLRPGERALVLATYVSDGSLRIRERGAIDIASFPSLWWVRASEAGEAERRALEVVARDVETGPDVIAIETPKVSAVRVRPGFSVPEYLERQPRVARALTRYRVDTTPHFLIYRR